MWLQRPQKVYQIQISNNYEDLGNNKKKNSMNLYSAFQETQWRFTYVCEYKTEKTKEGGVRLWIVGAHVVHKMRKNLVWRMDCQLWSVILDAKSSSYWDLIVRREGEYKFENILSISLWLLLCCTHLCQEFYLKLFQLVDCETGAICYAWDFKFVNNGKDVLVGNTIFVSND